MCLLPAEPVLKQKIGNIIRLLRNQFGYHVAWLYACSIGGEPLMGLQHPGCLLIWPVPSKNPALYCRCVWRFTADNLQDVQSSPAWQCPCCRPPPALALQYPPRSRYRTSLQLGSWERGLREETSFNSGSGDGIKRRPSHSGPSTPRRGVSASAEVQQYLQSRHLLWLSCFV